MTFHQFQKSMFSQGDCCDQISPHTKDKEIPKQINGDIDNKPK